jgi:cell division protein FtsW
VPLPFISYGSTNLIVLLGGMGLLMNVAATGGLGAQAAPPLRAIEGGRGAKGRDSGRRDGGARAPRPRRGRRAAG